jgi:hypothetical protein
MLALSRFLAKYFGFLILPLVFSPAISYAESTSGSETIQALKEKVKKLEKKSSRNRRASKKSFNSLGKLKRRMKVNGFLSVGVTRVKDDEATYLEELGNPIDDELNFQTDSLVGLQFEFKLLQQMSVVTQFLSQLGDSEELISEWAYLKYDSAEKKHHLKVGRVRNPMFLLSEYQEIGFTYPWVRPPQPLYFLTLVSNVEGVNYRYDFEALSWLYSVGVVYGATKSFALGVDIDIQNLTTVSMTAQKENLTLRAAASNARMEASGSVFDTLSAQFSGSGLSAMDPVTDTNFYNMGLRYDIGDWSILSELVKLEFHPPTIGGSFDMGYLAVTKRFGRWSTTFTYTKSQSNGRSDSHKLEVAEYARANFGVLADAVGDLLEGRIFETTDYTLTQRFDISSKIAVKFELLKSGNFGGGTRGAKSGYFDVNEGNILREIDDQYIYSVVLDAVF